MKVFCGENTLNRKIWKNIYVIFPIKGKTFGWRLRPHLWSCADVFVLFPQTMQALHMFVSPPNNHSNEINCLHALCFHFHVKPRMEADSPQATIWRMKTSFWPQLNWQKCLNMQFNIWWSSLVRLGNRVFSCCLILETKTYKSSTCKIIQ